MDSCNTEMCPGMPIRCQKLLPAQKCLVISKAGWPMVKLTAIDSASIAPHLLPKGKVAGTVPHCLLVYASLMCTPSAGTARRTKLAGLRFAMLGNALGVTRTAIRWAFQIRVDGDAGS